MGKEIIQMQLALFFKTDFLESFEKLSLTLKDKLGESKNTQHLPVPSDAPSGIPRLILVYENFNINISKNRLDLFFGNIDAIRPKISDISDILLNEFSLSIGRIGLVKNFFSRQDLSYLKTLLNEEKITKIDPKEINIRININLSINSFECNNIQNIINGKKKQAGGDEIEGIIITRDINTVAEKAKEYNMSSSVILDLFNKFDTESNSLIYE